MWRIGLAILLLGSLSIIGAAQEGIPDTHVIAYVAQVDNTPHTFVTDIAGQTQLVVDTGAYVRWSWDGTQLLVAPPQTQAVELTNAATGAVTMLPIPPELPPDAILLNVLPTWYRAEWMLHIADATNNTFYHAVLDEQGHWQYTQLAQFPSARMSVQMGDVGFHREGSDMLALLNLTEQGVNPEILGLPTNSLRPIEGVPARRMVNVLGFAGDGYHLALAEHDVTRAETHLYNVVVPPEDATIPAKEPAALLTNVINTLDAAWLPETKTLLMSVVSAPPAQTIALIEWNTETNSIALVTLAQPTNGIFDVSPDGLYIALGGTNGELWLLERATGNMQLLAQTQRINAIDWRPARLDP